MGGEKEEVDGCSRSETVVLSEGRRGGRGHYIVSIIRRAWDQ
jgi:hypothetical protein